MAGHTPLHPMYVSYSALPPPPYNHSNNTKSFNTNTTYSSGTASSHRSISRDTIGQNHSKNHGDILQFTTSTTRSRNFPSVSRNNTSRSNRSNADKDNPRLNNIDYPNDYSNPLDHLHRPVSPHDEYDSLDGTGRAKFQKNKNYYPHSSKYSPVVQPKMRAARSTANKQHRNSYKPRVFTDHVREQPLRSFYSDPRLAIDENDAVNIVQNRVDGPKRDSRPLSLYGNNF